MTREQREQAARTLQEFYDFNKTLTPQGDSWLQADITINRYTQEELGKALPTAIAALREPAHEWVRTTDRWPTEEDAIEVHDEWGFTHKEVAVLSSGWPFEALVKDRPAMLPG
ncbi:MAG: hypothetical protein PHX74_12405, partial [Candidatus Sumerlaeales bacterium]|nr:hypothetical protein [Candidatus Sumerlaeales bacterium]